MSPAGAEARSESGELAGYNLFSTHSALAEALAREGDADAAGPPAAFGTLPSGLDTQALMARVFG